MSKKRKRAVIITYCDGTEANLYTTKTEQTIRNESPKPVRITREITD